ncbi:zinc finger and BTB domain-containing protein 17-like isoform X5 [Venturia canescens]|uniref:zinc finger and BTB domain-containing protein 17-like isoform X5 n=1 Tax=Venturia canescens TaxID=32260 RepID=UPI001C9C0F0E|nr:zinc finger and BTB domain-containing protein 17-like isoform X5 [Venturia canescens]
MSSLDYLDLCRLCLVKDRVSVPIFEGEGDVRQIFLKIAACLPVKVGREDKLPKKICDDCVYKVELFYQFWNTTANAEKQLLQWLGEVSMDDKQGYVTGAHDPSMMKPGQNTGENRLDGSSVMQQVNEHTNNMGMGMMDGMGIGMPMMIPNSGQQPQQQQMTSVPMDTGGNAVQNVQPVPGPSAQIGQQKINAPTNEDEDEDESEEEDNSDDECDGDDGLPVKEESEDEPNRTIEPTTFVNVSLACDEAGPSGLQQQKIGEMPEMVMPPTDGDPKSGSTAPDPLESEFFIVKILDEFYRVPKSQCMKVVTLAPFPDAGTLEESTFKVKSAKEKKQNIRNEEETPGPAQAMEFVAVKTEYPSDDEMMKPEESSAKQDLEKKETEIQDKMIDSSAAEDCKIKSEAESTPPIKHESIDLDDVPLDEREFLLKVPSKGSEENALGDEDEGFSILGFRKSADFKRSKSEAIFVCKPCGYMFKHRSKYERHMYMHNGQRPRLKSYKCEPCGFKFSSKPKYDRHMNIHNREDDGTINYDCRPCGFQTAYKSKYDRHMKIHSKKKGEESPYHCCPCGYDFPCQSEYDRHMSLHVGKHAESMNYDCEICDEKFDSKWRYDRHIKTHNRVKPEPVDHECEICGRHFLGINPFKKHLQSHSDERPHKCDLCGRAFKRLHEMKKHRDIHGESVYNCDTCDFSSNYWLVLRSHLRSVHKGIRSKKADRKEET